MGEEGDESAEELRRRAGELRDCASRARGIAERLGPFLDSEVERAERSDPTIWQGPYAERTTGTLADHKRTLHDMADALMNDAGRWESEATDLEERAGQSEGGN